MFADREQAGERLAHELLKLKLYEPIVLAIPRGGVAVGAALARALRADLDVVLARKLRSPLHAELAIGAVGEDGTAYLNENVAASVDRQYIVRERRRQLESIVQRRQLYRGGAGPADVAGRSVILTDDGIATGSTMIAALHVIRALHAREIIVAVPVAPAQSLNELRDLADRLVCLHAPDDFRSVGQFYLAFAPVEDGEVVRLLREAAPASQRTASAEH